MRTFASIVGARPQFIKLAPVCRAFEAYSTSSTHRIIHTGQHYDKSMSEVFFDELQIPKPDIDLNVGSGTHGRQTAAMLAALETEFETLPPDVVIVYGDTNSTLAATLAATKMHIPVCHVEAGLRSFNRGMPEEINRMVADHCCDRLYAPTPQAMCNLRTENLVDRALHTGDVMLDATLRNIDLARRKSTVLSDMGLKPGCFGLVTIHRPANTNGKAMRFVLGALEKAAARELPLVFPVHPRTQVMLDDMGFAPPPGLMLSPPLPYLDIIALIESAAMVITDSGGMQKEAAFLNTPCLTVRDETEWTETIDIGINRLVGIGGPGLLEAFEQYLMCPPAFDEDVQDRIKQHFGRGDAAEKIVGDCVDWMN
jgi:UDP-N-acetylglucosamine 2-epimerase